MKPRSIILLSSLLGATGLAGLPTLPGCADSGEAPENADAAAPDLDATLPQSDSETPTHDATVDAAVDGDTDAALPARTCSDDGFCQTPLPAKLENFATPQVLTDVWSDGEGAAWSVTKEGRILRWDGSTWSVSREGQDELDAIWGSGPTDLWAGGVQGILHGTGATSATITWTEVPSLPGDAESPILTLWGTSATDLWAAGGRSANVGNQTAFAGRVLHFDGAAWSSDPRAPTDVRYRKLWGDGSELWASVETSSSEVTFVHKAQGDAMWTSRFLGAACGLNISLTPAFGGNASSILFAGGVGVGTKICMGTRDPSADGGLSSWTLQTIETDSMARTALWSSGAHDIWVAGQYGRVEHWDGTKWLPARISLEPIPFTRDFTAMFGRPGKDLWIVGSDIAYRKELP